MSGFGTGRLGGAALRGGRESVDAPGRAGLDWLTVDGGEDFGRQALCHCAACGGGKVHDPGDPQQLTIPGDTTTTETLAIGGSRTGIVDIVGDDDFYQVQLVAGQHYVFTMTGDGGAPLADCYLELYDSTGALIALDDDAGPGTDALLRFTAVSSGTYYLNARAFEDPETGQNNTGGYLVAAAIGAPQNPLDTINLNFTVSQQNITVFFAPQGYQNPLNDTALRAWTPQEIAAALDAFATFEAITNLTFTQVFSEADARFVMSLADLEPGTLGYFATRNGTGYGAFDPAGNGWSNGLSPGGLGFVTLIHEIGHGLGLAHPQDNGGNSEVMQGVISDFNSYGTFGLNQGVFTTMTYNDGFPTQPGGSFSNSQFGAQATPMPLDIALLQQKYGADPNTNSGDNTYTLVDSNAVGTRYVGIWDTGGVDNIVYGGSRNTIIDLRPATLLNAEGGGGYVSYATGIWGGFVVAAGVVIENATSGLGNDTLTGNNAANVLTGNFGDDVLRGGAGADTLIGGDGDDTLDDMQGLNSYNGGAGTDFATVSLATRTGALSYTVGDADILENGSALIAFSGIERVSIVGGAGNDVFVGGSLNDVLDGGAGADVLTGSFGNDIYGVDSFQDVIVEAGADTDTVQTTLTNLSVTNFSGIENLTYVGTAPFIGQGDAGINVLVGGSGNDYFYAYGGADTARGNAGIDVFILADGGDSAFGGEGQDYIFGDGGNDILNGESGVDVLLGGDGDDTLIGGDGGDYFYGENGNDNALGEAGNDIFVLTSGNDTATGGDGQDYFYMGDGNDTLNGEAGVDVMLGEAGDDTFNPGLGVDYVFMGSGSDRLVADAVFGGVTVLNDFTPGAASSDVVQLTNTSFTSFAQVQASISDFTASGGFCILTIDGDSSVWFIGVSPSQLTPDDFILGGG